MKNNKIFLVSTSKIPIPPEKGGAIEKLLFDIYSLLRDEMDIYLVSSRRIGNFDYKIIKVGNFNNKIMSVISEFLFGIKLFNLSRKERPSILHLNTPFNSLPIVFMRKFLKGTRIVYTSHNPSWTVDDKELSFLNVLIERMESWVMKRVDAVVAVSRSMKNGFTKKAGIPKKKIRIIYNFVDTERFSPKYGKNWKRLNKINGPMILYVGKLTETKGVSYLIKSIPKVVEEFPNSKFVFVGGIYYGEEGNPYKNLIEKLGIRKYVYFTGPVSEDELPKIYSSADILVLPTNREAFGLVLVEAMASGLPSIVSDIPVLHEITGEDSSIFVRRGFFKSISNAILNLLRHKKKIKKMSLKARKKSLKFDKHVQVKKYKKLYESLL